MNTSLISKLRKSIGLFLLTKINPKAVVKKLDNGCMCINIPSLNLFGRVGVKMIRRYYTT